MSYDIQKPAIEFIGENEEIMWLTPMSAAGTSPDAMRMRVTRGMEDFVATFSHVEVERMRDFFNGYLDAYKGK